jgi:hypothetical protein
VSNDPAPNIQLTSISNAWRADEERWEVVLELSFSNEGRGVFELDKATACAGGRVTNHVFEVSGPSGEVDYRGMMKKRAHPGPEGFHQIAPGERVQVQVDLGEDYAFPKEGGTFSVRFDHFNHFAKDSVQLVSEPASLELRP